MKRLIGHRRLRQSSDRTTNSASQHQGSVLLVVLVVVAFLSLGAYTFSELMLSEAEATAMHANGVKVRLCADSGIQFVTALLQARLSQQPGNNLSDNPDLFQAVLVDDSNLVLGPARFSIIAEMETTALGNRFRFGLMDESSKLNLNTLPLKPYQRVRARNMLLGLQKMTPRIADAILDWLDPDDEPSEFGAENEYYTSLSPPYTTRNGRLRSLDDLLMVRGVTPELLFGEDTNRNGLLDENENDGAVSLPMDDSDDVLETGWAKFLTLDSRETNRQPDGSPKLNLNHNRLHELYDQLEVAFNRRMAQFVVAYRLKGSIEKNNEIPDSMEDSEADRRADAIRRARRQLRDTPLEETEELAPEDRERDGLDLTMGATYPIKSLFDLFGAAVRIEIDGTDSILDSPWSDDPGSMQGILPELASKLTVHNGPMIEGRINVNEAPREVLLMIPGLTPELADAIVAAQRGVTGRLTAARAAGRTTVSWLLYEGLVDLPRLKQMAPYITARGDLFRVRAIGYFDAGGPSAHVEAVVDATFFPPRVTVLRDMPPLESYRLELLKQGAGRATRSGVRNRRAGWRR